MTINICFGIVLLYILFTISIEDINTMLISENKLIALFITGFIYLLTLGLFNKEIYTTYSIIYNLFSMVVIFILMYSISFLSYKILGINSLGMGDIKLSSISTIWLGIKFSLISLCISFLLSAIYSLHGKIFEKSKPLQQYPFAPFISTGIFFCWITDKI